MKLSHHSEIEQGGFGMIAMPIQGVRTRYSLMMTSLNGNIFLVTGHLCGEFTGHRWIPHTKVSDAELWCFLWSARMNGWVNNRDAGDLGHHCASYDVIVMDVFIFINHAFSLLKTGSLRYLGSNPTTLNFRYLGSNPAVLEEDSWPPFDSKSIPCAVHNCN